MDFPSMEIRVVEWEEQMQESDSKEGKPAGMEGKGRSQRQHQRRGEWREGKAGPWGTSYLGIIMEQPANLATGRKAGPGGVGRAIILNPRRHLGKRTRRIMLEIQTVL